MICLFFSPEKASVFFTFSSFLFAGISSTQHKGKAFRATTQQQQRAQTLCAIQSSAGRKKSERD
jgi:hypothetical protein